MSKRSGSGVKSIVSFLVSLFVVAGLVLSVAKANSISDASSFIDWSRKASTQLKDCMQPDIKFWTCSKDIAFGGGSKDSDSSTTPPPQSDFKPTEKTSAMLTKLSKVKVGNAQKVDYNRNEWKHWVGDRCNDTRQQVLKEQAKSYKLDKSNCKVASGVWIDPYTGAKFTDPSKLDIDHVYALGAAAKNGGNNWSASKKQQFANDKSHLLAVSASANRSKSDKNPADWWPENGAHSCQFASIYVNTASKYDLQFSKADVRALEKGLKTCG